MKRALISFLLAGLIVPVVFSQSTSSTKQASGKASSTTKTRARRSTQKPKPAEEKPSPAEDKTVADPTPAEKFDTQTPVTKPADDQSSKPAETEKAKDEAAESKASASASDNKVEPAPPADPIADLRHRIEGASDQEKLRLQLKLADELTAAGRQPEALSELLQAASTNIFDPTSFYNIGNSFARLGVADAAVNAYRKAIDQRKGKYSRAYNNMGVIMLRAGRWDDAQQAFLSALKLEGFRYAEASYNLGRVYAAQGQNDLASREWRRALAVDPGHTAAAEALARNANRENIVVEPQPTNESKPKFTPVAEPGSRKSGSDQTRPDAGLSASRSQRNLTIDPVSFDYLQRARSASERGNISGAIDNYRRLISRQGGYFAPANLEMSYALITSKRYDDALASLIQVATKDGARYPISYYHLARVYEAKGDLKQAEVAFTEAWKAYGAENSQFLLDLSRVREKQGDYKGALDAMQQYVNQVEAKGLKYSWSDERLATLRQKAQGLPKQ